ncbi:hypothetical protein BGZ54_010227 [Gamsiella multidivaricata]|nr:hypothetical protein BGZ54_010227 [Gamsiella multidivaricata]
MLRLLRGNAGVMSEYDYALVENTLAKEGENPIVACVSLHAVPGYYGNVKLQYGRPECVGSLPAYRNRGLVRRLFLEMINPASDARGDIIQYIPGIPHFYRQFGYEYALSIPTPLRVENLAAAIPPRPTKAQESDPEPESEPFSLRMPALDDIPYLLKMSTPKKLHVHAELGLIYDEAYWRYTIHDRIQTAQSKYDCTRRSRIIVDAKTGKDCGVIVADMGRSLTLTVFSLEDGYHYRDAIHPVLRQMIDILNQPNRWELKEEKEAAAKAQSNAIDAKSDSGDESKKDEEKQKTVREPKVKAITSFLDRKHPVSRLLESASTPMPWNYKLYTRILSYAKFILKVAPELEARLAKSPLAGITVTLHCDFFRKMLGTSGRGLEVVIRNGKIVSASDGWVPPTPEETMLAARARIAKAKEEGRPDKKPLEFKADFAPMTFTRLLVGDLSIDEMLHFYGECSVQGGPEAKLLLEILFPKQEFYCDMFWW